MLNLLHSDFHANASHPLYERATGQWARLTGGLLLDGAGAAIIGAGIKLNYSPIVAEGGVIAGLGLLATGFALGQLHETSQVYAAELQSQTVE